MLSAPVSTTANQGTAAAQTAPWPVEGGATATQTVTWDSTTPNSTQITVSCLGMSAIIVGIKITSGTASAGQISFASHPGSGNRVTCTGWRQTGGGAPDFTADTVVDIPTMGAFARSYTFNCAGWDSIDIQLSPAIVGSATVLVSTRAVAGGTPPSYSIVGQLDQTKLNATVQGSNGSVAAIAVGSLGPTLTIVSNPAAGANWAFTVPSGIWRLISWSALLTTSNQVANRVVVMDITDGGGHFLADITAHFTQTASLAWRYSGSDAPIANTTANVDGSIVQMPVPSNMLLLSGWQLNSFIAGNGIQTNDQWSAITVVLERVG